MFFGKTRIRLLFILALIFIPTVVSVVFIVQYQTNRIINELTLKQAQTANRSLHNYLSELKERVSMRAEVIAGNEVIITAVKNRDYEILRKNLIGFSYGIDFASVCDSNGIVLAESISDISGSDISLYKGISAALNTGIARISLEQVKSVDNHLSVFASVPIFDSGKVIGVVNCYYDLTEHEYIDLFKERSGCEAGIFFGDVYVTSTLRDENDSRITGSKAFDFVTETVINQKRDYSGILELYGKVYVVCYTPLRADDEIIGMLFTGIDINSILKNQRAMNYWIITAAFTGICVSVAFISFSGKMINKLEHRTSIVENSPHIIFYTDPKGNLNYANPAVSAFTGYSEEEIEEGGFCLLFGEDTTKKIKNEYIPVTIKEGIARREVELICKDGSKRVLNVTSFLMKQGVVAGIAMDLTEIRELQNELIKAKNKAEQASRAKGEFLSNMSHEMRTPMNAIIGMTEIARNACDDDRRIYALNRVEEASKHLLAIINDVLDMSKIEANKFELTDVMFDLREMLQKAASFVRFTMQGKKHKFSMNVDSKVPRNFIGDDQRLTQVITNLFSNAVKFTPENGSIGLNVTLVNQKHGVSELCFEVFDSGIGISPEKKEKIFYMFEQAENGTTRKYGGTGLGLSISKHIVELMGGKINVESEVGAGSRFIFTVKFLEAEEAADIGKLEELDEDFLKNEFSGKKLLFAEDIEINREILISMLENTGFFIETAENGKDALEKYKENPGYFDIILMDVQMPVMDGLEATKEIRKFEQSLSPEFPKEHMENTALEFAQQTPRLSGCAKHIPIIAMTANVFKEDIDACISAGMNDHIGKPLDRDTVLEKLRRYLSTARIP